MPRFSHSRLMTARKCMRSYWWRYHRKLTKAAKPIYFTIGEIWHEGHKRWYHPTSYFMSEEDRVDATLAHVREYGKKVDADDETINLIERMTISLIRKSLQEDDFNAISVEQWIEVPFATDGRDDVTYVSKQDALVLTERTGMLKVLEGKTTGAIGTNYLNMLKHGPQAKSSVWTAQKALKKEIKGVVFNVCNKAKTPKCVEARAMVNQREIDLWESTTKGWIQYILSLDPEDKEQWLRNEDECYTFYGECDYLPLEKYGETPEVMSLYMEYREHKPGIKTDGGI